MFASIRIKSLATLAGLALSALVFTGCFTATEDEDTQPARVTVEMNLGASQTLAKSEGGLGKASAAGSRRMVVLMTSSKRDTLCDTITSRGSLLSQEPTFIGSNSDGQTVTALYNLAPHRKWKVTVNVSDAQDSLWYSDSSTIEDLKAFDRRTVSLSLDSRFSAYTAQFPLPAAVASRQVYFTRLTLSIDGVLVHDSLVTATAGSIGSGAFLTADAARLPGSLGKCFFKPTSIALNHEYVKSGSREFALAAYGYLEGDTVGVTPERLLFQGGRSVATALGKAAAVESVPLDFKAAGAADTEAGNTRMFVKLGKIGKVIVNVTMSGALDF